MIIEDAVWEDHLYPSISLMSSIDGSQTMTNTTKPLALFWKHLLFSYSRVFFFYSLHMQVPSQGSVISTGSSSSTMFNNVAATQIGGLWLRFPVGHRVPVAHFCMSQLQSSASMEILFRIIYPGSYWSQLTVLIPGSPMIPAWLSCRNQLTQTCSA